MDLICSASGLIYLNNSVLEIRLPLTRAIDEKSNGRILVRTLIRGFFLYCFSKYFSFLDISEQSFVVMAP